MTTFPDPELVTLATDPVSPFCPLRFLNVKLNTFAVLSPEAVTVTDGVPTLASTVAVGVPNPAAAPVCPPGPTGPCGPWGPCAP